MSVYPDSDHDLETGAERRRYFRLNKIMPARLEETPGSGEPGAEARTWRVRVTARDAANNSADDASNSHFTVSRFTVSASASFTKNTTTGATTLGAGELFLRLLHSRLVHVAHGHQLASGVDRFHVAHAHASGADHGARENLAWGRVARTAEDMARDDGDRRHGGDGGLEEGASVDDVSRVHGVRRA